MASFLPNLDDFGIAEYPTARGHRIPSNRIVKLQDEGLSCASELAPADVCRQASPRLHAQGKWLCPSMPLRRRRADRRSFRSDQIVFLATGGEFGYAIGKIGDNH